MAKKDDYTRTIGYGEAALGQIKRNEVPAYPKNYELWYTYSAGFNHALNKAINEILRARGAVTAEEIDQIYNRYMSPQRLGERIEEVGSQISDEIAHIVDKISASQDTASDYKSSLEGAKTALSGTMDGEQVREIVGQIIIATKQTEAANQALEGQLADSKRQIQEMQESLEAIRFESLTDELTTLANRKHFDQSLERAIADAEVTDEPLSLLMTDIDHFKKFNDTFGHQTGDQVLRLVALAVKQNVKGQDIACRYGGEEFGVILPMTNLKQAISVAENIRKSVMSKELVKRSTGENLGRITISIGVSTFHKPDTPQTMIERSDQCLYAAKRAGRNRVLAETDMAPTQSVQVA
ncbi:MAG: GGDEF domain-containing protein [Pseudomonadota bacterium]